MKSLTVHNQKGVRVAIIGVGKIGSNVAFQLYDKFGRKGLIEEITLIEKDKAKAFCVAEEITHANDGSISTLLKPCTTPDSAIGCDFIVYSAGRTILPGEKREDLLKENGLLAMAIFDGLKFNGNEIFITVTNPVDVLNTYFSRELGLPANQVIALGGMLDSARFRQTVAEHIGHNSNTPVLLPDVKNAFVLGQHGNGFTPLFERLKLPPNAHELNQADIEKIREELAEIVPRLIKVRGCADFAPSTHVFRMIELLLQDSASAVECCSVVPPKQFQMHYGGEILDVSFGVPVTLKRDGATTVALEISEDSQNSINKGVKEIRDYVGIFYDNVVADYKRKVFRRANAPT